MKSPQLYFYRRRRMLDYLPWVLLLLASIVLLVQFDQYQRLQAQQQLLNARLQTSPSLPKRPTQALSEGELARYQALSKIVAQLNQPIYQLQDRVAGLNNPNVVLLSMEQGDPARGVMLTVETKDAKSMSEYWRRLNALPNVSAQLREKTVRQEPGYVVTRAVFAVEEK